MAPSTTVITLATLTTPATAAPLRVMPGDGGGGSGGGCGGGGGDGGGGGVCNALSCSRKNGSTHGGGGLGGGGDAAGGVGMSCRGRAQVGESCGADPVGELIPNGPCEKDLACMNTLCTKRGSLGEPCKVYDQSGASSCETGNACFVNVYEGKEEVHCGPLSSPGGPCTEFYHCASGLVCERDSKKETKNTCVAATTTDAPAFKSIARTTTKKKTTISDKYLMAYEAAFN